MKLEGKNPTTLSTGINNYRTALPKKMMNLLFLRAFKLRYMCFSEKYSLVQVYTVWFWWTWLRLLKE